MPRTLTPFHTISHHESWVLTDHAVSNIWGNLIRWPIHGKPIPLTVCNTLTHWGRVTHICVSKLTIIGSDNGWSPDRRQAIIWTNAGILSIRPLGTKLSEISIVIHIFSFKKMQLKMCGKWWSRCLGLNILTFDFTKMIWQDPYLPSIRSYGPKARNQFKII